MTRTLHNVSIYEYIHWLARGWTLCLKPGTAVDSHGLSNHGEFGVLMELPHD